MYAKIQLGKYVRIILKSYVIQINFNFKSTLTLEIQVSFCDSCYDVKDNV